MYKLTQETIDIVRKWLIENGARFISEGNRIEVPVDFVVYEPFCFALEIMDFTSPNTMRRKARRLLARRIALIEEFGPGLPLIVISCGVKDSLLPHPSKLFADAVLPAQQLPVLKNLRNIEIQVDTEKILSTGAPKNIQHSELEILDNRWQFSISPIELIEKEDFLPGTLAHKIHDLAITLLKKDDCKTVFSRSHFKHELVGAQDRLTTGQEPHNTFEKIVRNRNFFKGIQEIIGHEIKTKVGTGLQSRRIKIMTQQTTWLTLDLPVLSLPNETQIVIRLLVGSESLLGHKADELLAEAWMIRASELSSSANLFLLLTENKKNWREENITGEKRLPPSPSLLKSIHKFESAGWQVFPWDFEKTTPEFLNAIIHYTGNRR